MPSSFLEPSGNVQVSPDLEVSPLDTRFYRALTLPNHLRVLIVSDNTSDKAAASLDVSVGNYSDPPQLPGLAHFLEHMLFLGTDKYPEEGSYNTFLSENGGYSNAYTSSENTNFHFDMLISDRDPKHPAPRFREALDRFAQFFTSPLFTESAADRELNAVHSEHQKNLQNDMRRIYQLKRSAANPEHPFSKFGTGSKETLDDIPRESGIDTRAQLLAFYREYYSANLMNLCIIAPYPLDLLQQWTVDLFSAIPNQQRKNPCEEYRHLSPLLDDHYGLMFHIEPVRDIRLLELSWHTPTYIHDYRSKPSLFVSCLLDEEGEGSVLSLLKKRGWCDSLCIGTGDMMTFGIVQMTVTLTNEGVNFINDIIDTIYQYIRMLKRDGIPKWLFDEEAGLSEISFRFRESEDPVSFVTRITSKMPCVQPEEYLSSHFLYKKYDPAQIEEVLNAFTPENGNIVVVGKFVAGSTDRKERWYKSPYRVERVDEASLKRWNSSDIHKDLYLPPVNPFIPTKFDILGEPLPDGEKTVEGPTVVERNENFVLFHHLDRTFQLPSARITIQFWTPWVYVTPRHGAMAYLLTTLLEDSLTEYSYPAAKAGFTYRLDKTGTGLLLVIDGYSHRIDVLLDAIVRKMKNFEVDENRFAVQKDLAMRNYINFEKNQPVSLAMYGISHLLEQPRWHIREYVECFNRGEITLDRMKQFAKEVVEKMWVSALVCGNVKSEDAIKMMQGVQQTLGYMPLRNTENVKPRVVELPIGQEVYFRRAHVNEDDNNSAIEVFFQIGALGDFARDVRLELLSEILNKPAFHELRTVQQLGYMVFEGIRDIEGVRGLYFIVQSTVADPDELMKRIDEFLIDVRKVVLDAMTGEKFQDYATALTANKAEPDRTLAVRSSRFWGEIDRGFLQFDREEREIEALRKVTKEEVIEMFDDYIAKDGKYRRKIVSQIYGNQHPFDKRKNVPDGALDVTDVSAFKTQRPLYPIVGRHLGVE